MRNTLLALCALFLLASCGDKVEILSPTAMIDKTWYCVRASDNSVETIHLTQDGQWSRKLDARDSAGFGAVHEETGSYVLTGDTLDVRVAERESPKANKGFIITWQSAAPVNDKKYKIHEVRKDNLTLDFIGDDGKTYPRTCGLAPVSNVLAGNVLVKGADICGSHKSMMKVLAAKRARNPYVPQPSDCLVAEKHLPVKDVSRTGDLIKFRYDGYYYWTHDTSISVN